MASLYLELVNEAAHAINVGHGVLVLLGDGALLVDGGQRWLPLSPLGRTLRDHVFFLGYIVFRTLYARRPRPLGRGGRNVVRRRPPLVGIPSQGITKLWILRLHF